MATIIIITPPKNPAQKIGESRQIEVAATEDMTDAEILRAAADQLEDEE